MKSLHLQARILVFHSKWEMFQPFETKCEYIFSIYIIDVEFVTCNFLYLSIFANFDDVANSLNPWYFLKSNFFVYHMEGLNSKKSFNYRNFVRSFNGRICYIYWLLIKVSLFIKETRRVHRKAALNLLLMHHQEKATDLKSMHHHVK